MYSVCLRIEVSPFLPIEIQTPRTVLNVSAFSTKKIPGGTKVFLSEAFKEAEVIGCRETARSADSFSFNLG